MIYAPMSNRITEIFQLLNELSIQELLELSSLPQPLLYLKKKNNLCTTIDHIKSFFIILHTTGFW